jgi:hypothetical protein
MDTKSTEVGVTEIEGFSFTPETARDGRQTDCRETDSAAL